MTKEMGLLQTFARTIQLFLSFFIILEITQLAHADPPYFFCTTTARYTYNETVFQNNLKKLMLTLPFTALVSKMYNASSGNGTDSVYGQYLCLNYVDTNPCGSCVRTASYDIMFLCPKQIEAVVWEETCQLRYSYNNFLGHLDVSGNIPKFNMKNISEPERFKLVVNQTLTDLANTAAFNRSTNMYATKKVPFTAKETIYAVVQCTTDLSSSDCNTCLRVAIANISSCCYFYRGARLLSRSCYLRYELYAFYEGATSEDTASEQNPGTEKVAGHRIWMIIIITLAATIVVVIPLSFLVYYAGVMSGIKIWKYETTNQGNSLDNIGDRNNSDFHNSLVINSLNAREYAFMDLASIQAATDNYADSNMLGQGGFGPVYKGVLKDGKKVAVKRLSSCSEQGTEEFTNEVLLIMKLQHKNLVRLLGYCVEREEKILVYEFMPNCSLDAILFDPRKRAQLDWSRRIRIINGIAKGILYLHVDSRLRIIHRDLKASNILLDNDMNPKISDFGLARIFKGSEGEANTLRIIGTYGYMAPEYAMEGLYSVKSDVFSFGVLLLEIITGRRNDVFHRSKRVPSLLAYAWNLHNEGNELELLDPLMTESYCSEEFLRYMHIGLLCVQEDACDRPSMSSVVMMLRSENSTLPLAKRPALSVGTFVDHEQAIPNGSSVNKLTISEILPR